MTINGSFKAAHRIERDETTSIASTLSWNTFLSRTSVSSLNSAAFSDPSSTSQIHGLEDVLNTVRTLSLRRFQYEEIERQDVLGEGESFIVERCVLRNLTLAIKHLKANVLPDDLMFRRRLKSAILELRIMRHAPLRDHPNILAVFGYGWNTKGSQIMPYLLVEYAPYGTLRQYLRHFKSELSTTQKQILLGDVASAITALHLCGIIHGDIKLDNVLMFHSWDRPAKSIAKIADFGHSLVISAMSDDPNPSYIRYTGTSIYNAPEVQNQLSCPIDRTALHKCDVWAFGLLVWETILDGEEYTKRIADCEATSSENGKEPDIQNPEKFLELAKSSLPFSKSNLRDGILRWVLNMTIQVNPAKRISNLAKLPLMSKWHSAGIQGLEAELALHFGSSEWTYEMFRSENGKETPWEHEEQIYQGLQRTYSSSQNSNGNVAWQLALCQYLGFGGSPHPASAYQSALAAKRLDHPVAKLFAPLFFPHGIPEFDNFGATYANKVLKLLLQSKTPPEESPFMEACCKGNVTTVFRLLKDGIGATSSTEDGCSILHFLFLFENSPLQKQVAGFIRLQNREVLDVNHPSTSVRVAHAQWPLRLVGSPLVFAISTYSLGAVRLLLSLGASPFMKAFAHGQFPEGDHRSGWLPIHVAVQYHCHEILSELLALETSSRSESQIPFACALSYSSLLERVAIHGSNRRIALDKTIAILRQVQSLTDTAPNGMTPLMQAIDFQDADVVSALLRADPHIASSPLRDPRNSKEFNLPIHFAAQLASRRDIPETLQIMIVINDITADMNFKNTPPLDSAGRTPLHLAVTGPSRRASSWILDRRPGLLNIEDNFGRTALHCCHSATNAEFLLSKGADPNHTDKSGMTAMHVASLRGDLQIVLCLLKHNPMLDLKNNRYGTPLHCAIVRGSSEVVTALIEAGSPINEVDQFGDAPIHVASALCRHNILRLLIQNGADVKMKNADGHTAADLASRLGTMASIFTLKVLLGENTSANGDSAAALYSQYWESGFDVNVLPVYEQREAPQPSDSVISEPDVATGMVELIDYAGSFLSEEEQGALSLETGSISESQEGEGSKSRKIAEFTYNISTDFSISLTAARRIIRLIADLADKAAYIAETDPGDYTSLMKSEDRQKSDPLGWLLVDITDLVRDMHIKMGVPGLKLLDLETRLEGNGLHENSWAPWNSLARSTKILFWLAKPVWDVFDLDDKLVARVADFTKALDDNMAARVVDWDKALDDVQRKAGRVGLSAPATSADILRTLLSYQGTTWTPMLAAGNTKTELGPAKSRRFFSSLNIRDRLNTLRGHQPSRK